MVIKTGPINPILKNLIQELKVLSAREKVPLWKKIAKDLERPARIRRSVNIFKINKYTREKETAIVPGKVLSDGELKKKLTVAAFLFSKQARNKINKIGKAITINELMKQNPKGKNVRIIG